MVAQFTLFVRSVLQFVFGFTFALVAALVVGLLYFGWAVAMDALKPLFAYLFRLAVNAPEPMIAEESEPKEPRVYYEQWEDGRYVNYLGGTDHGIILQSKSPSSSSSRVPSGVQ